MLELGYDLGEACQRVFDRMLCQISFLCVFLLATTLKITVQLLQN